VALPHIAFFACGGTISSVAPTTRDPVAPRLGAAAILASAPTVLDLARVDAHDFSTVRSIGISLEEMLSLTRAVANAFRDGCDGAIITHGTDTLEEVAYALALMLPRGKPIVVTGAMRSPSQLGADGPANLLSAFCVTTNSAAAHLGPVVVLDDEIHAARFATKLHTSKTSAFASPESGPLGEIVENRSDIWWTPAWTDELGLPETLGGVEVEIVRIAAGMSDMALRATIAASPDAVVIEALGGGHLESSFLPALDELIATGIPVITASRSLAGATLERTYGMPGGEIDLIDRGVIPVGRLAGHKARLRLLVGLSLGMGPHDLFPVH